MIIKKFSVYDSKAEAYLPDFEANTTALAIRSFSDAANQEEHNFRRHAADYTLFEIGARDDKTGRLTTLDAFINLGTALEHIEPVQKPPMSINDIALLRERG